MQEKHLEIKMDIPLKIGSINFRFLMSILRVRKKQTLTPLNSSSEYSIVSEKEQKLVGSGSQEPVDGNYVFNGALMYQNVS